MTTNPNYRGPWSPQRIKNPEYKVRGIEAAVCGRELKWTVAPYYSMPADAEGSMGSDRITAILVALILATLTWAGANAGHTQLNHFAKLPDSLH
jgi:hypothetical protein